MPSSGGILVRYMRPRWIVFGDDTTSADTMASPSVPVRWMIARLSDAGGSVGLGSFISGAFGESPSLAFGELLLHALNETASAIRTAARDIAREASTLSEG